jgi:uncharacterized damage-inducible protein DinB
MKRSLVLLLTLCAAPAAAQSNTVLGSVAPIFQTTTGYLQAAAEQMPEADYGYQPTPEIRTFAQLVGHVANAQNMFCNMALGEQPQGGRNWEEVTDKAALVEALRASTALCRRAYALPDDAAMRTVQMFGQERTILTVLATNAAHNFEHYGNIVTYMRLKGMVPPSSQPQN